MRSMKADLMRQVEMSGYGIALRLWDRGVELRFASMFMGL